MRSDLSFRCRMSRGMEYGTVAIALLALIAPRCQGAAKPKATRSTGAKHSSQAVKKAPADPFADLTPLASGNGAVVFDPVATGADPVVAAFGAGCSRWLNLAVGGHGELGKTPSLGAVNKLRSELHLPDLRLAVANAGRVVALLGATHAVTAKIQGTSPSLTLVFQVYRVEAKPIAVGQPVKLAGSEARIMAMLPAAAGQIATTLGVKTTRVPREVLTDADGLRFLGGLTWSPNEDMTDDDVARLASLAAVMAAESVRLEAPKYNEKATQCVKANAPDNALAWMELANNSNMHAHGTAPDIQRLSKVYPNNALLCVAQINNVAQDDDYEGKLAIVKHLVRCIPSASRAWRGLGVCYAEMAQSIRKSRMPTAMSKDENQAVFSLYPYWVVASARAVKLDSASKEAWLSLSESACADGEFGVADEAYWKALELGPASPAVLCWGLQMYQPKWIDDKAKLDRVVDTAVAARYGNPFSGLNVAGNIANVDAQYATQAKQLTERMIAEAQAHLKERPGNLARRYVLAETYFRTDRNDEARGIFLGLNKQYPMEPDFAIGAASTCFNTGRKEQSISILRDLRTAGFANAASNASLGEMLYFGNQYSEAETILREALRLEPTNYKASDTLAQVLFQLKRYAEAAEVQRVNVRRYPYDPRGWQNLIGDLRLAGKLGEALSAARDAVVQCRESVPLRRDLSDLLSSNGDRFAAIAVMRDAIELDSKDPVLHERLANLFMLSGDMKAAIPEWRTVIATTTYKPLIPQHRFYLAKCLLAIGQKDEAIVELRAALKEYPHGGSSIGIRQLLVHIGVTSIETPGSAPRSEQEVLDIAGQLRLPANRAERLQLLQSATIQFPNSARIRTVLGEHLTLDNRCAEAEVVYRDATRLAPQDAEAWRGLANALRRQFKMAGSQRRVREGGRGRSARWQLVVLTCVVFGRVRQTR